VAAVWLPLPLAAAAGIAAVVLVRPADRLITGGAAAIGVLLLYLVVLTALRRGARLRRAESRLASAAAAAARLGEQVLPAAVQRARAGEPAETVIRELQLPAGTGQEVAEAHGAVLRSVVHAVAREGDLHESAQRAFVSLARRMQSSINQMLKQLGQLEQRYDQDPEMFEALLRLDHGAAQAGRLADSIAVLGGAPPGRQWRRPVPLVRVIRGAMSRITEFQRVRLHAVDSVAVDGTAVEALIHALAELLDNATKCSPSSTQVHVSAHQVHNGVVIEIEDGGVGLSEEKALWAGRVLGGEQAIDLAYLGEAPRFGLAVVGLLARSLGARVELKQSSYGGVRVVMLVPRAWLKPVQEPAPASAAITEPAPAPALAQAAHVRPVARPVARPAPQPVPQAVAQPAAQPAAEPVARTEHGLPRRRRGESAAAELDGGDFPLAAPASSELPAAHSPAAHGPAEPPAESRHAFIGALQRASRGESEPAPAPTPASTPAPQHSRPDETLQGDTR
jgi:signal transduction histidine kinase